MLQINRAIRKQERYLIRFKNMQKKRGSWQCKMISPRVYVCTHNHCYDEREREIEVEAHIEILIKYK